MLNESPPQTLEKRICILAHNAALRQMLSGLLSEWRYHLVDTPAAANLVLVEEGIPLPEPEVPVLWLSRSEFEERRRLNMPLKIEKLWSVLESHFHTPPRKHIRLYGRIPVSITVRGKRIETAIVSLSDLGTRFDYPGELVPGEEVSLLLDMGGEAADFQGRVIYAVSGEGVDAIFQTGMIFDRTPAQVRTRLGEYIISTYLEAARKKIESWAFVEGLTCLDLPDAVVRRLQSGR